MGCGSTEHSTSECPFPFFRMTCANCGKECREVKAQAPMCRFVKAKQEADWKARQAEYDARKARKETQSEASTRPDSLDDYEERQKARCEKILQDAAPKGCLALSEDEERQARKTEKVLRTIANLDARLDRGEKLDKLQLQKIQTKVELESGVVMVKIRAGARRPII